MRQGWSLLTLLISIVFEVLAKEIREEKDGKDIESGKGEVKLSLFTDGMILDLRPCQNILRFNKLFSKVAGHKTNTQK